MISPVAVASSVKMFPLTCGEVEFTFVSTCWRSVTAPKPPVLLQVNWVEFIVRLKVAVPARYMKEPFKRALKSLKAELLTS